jgi:hypothetical protein
LLKLIFFYSYLKLTLNGPVGTKWIGLHSEEQAKKVPKNLSDQ